MSRPFTTSNKFRATKFGIPSLLHVAGLALHILIAFDIPKNQVANFTANEVVFVNPCHNVLQ
jgi:hypothetical protein